MGLHALTQWQSYNIIMQPESIRVLCQNLTKVTTDPIIKAESENVSATFSTLFELFLKCHTGRVIPWLQKRHIVTGLMGELESIHVHIMKHTKE